MNGVHFKRVRQFVPGSSGCSFHPGSCGCKEKLVAVDVTEQAKKYGFPGLVEVTPAAWFEVVALAPGGKDKDMQEYGLLHTVLMAAKASLRVGCRDMILPGGHAGDVALYLEDGPHGLTIRLSQEG